MNKRLEIFLSLNQTYSQFEMDIQHFCVDYSHSAFINGKTSEIGQLCLSLRYS